MAMNKLLYVLPVLVILGMLPAADADKTQERIERLQERIAELQERIDQNPDSKKVAKWEANIDRLQNRIAELEAKLEPAQTAKATQSATPRQDTTPPTMVSAEANLNDSTVTVEFSEAIDVSESFGLILNLLLYKSPDQISLTPQTSGDSSVIVFDFTSTEGRVIDETWVVVANGGAVKDLSGNGNEHGSIPLSFDTTPPSFVSAELDMNDGTLTVVFDEVIDISSVQIGPLSLVNLYEVTDRQNIGDSQFDNTADDSETVVVTLRQSALDWVGDKTIVVAFISLADPAGNYYHNPSNGQPVKVIPADTTPPVITLVGADPLAHELGEPYTDPGADADDGSPVTVDASAVDVNRSGDYIVTYTATDEHGNEGTATRTVQVRDTAGPAVVSATFDVTAETLTIVFDKTIDLSEVHLEEIGLGRYTLAGTTFDAAAPDSDTLVLDGHWSTAGNVLGLENPELAFGRNSVRDTDGNGIRAVTVPVALANVPVPDATVTITADGRFAEDAGTIEVQPGGDMTIEVRFVNGHGSDHTVLADLISWNFGHQSEDIEIRSGQSATVTFTVQNEAPRIADNPGRANVYLVFGVADIPGTPEHEPDEILGDRAIKVRIAEPAS